MVVELQSQRVLTTEGNIEATSVTIADTKIVGLGERYGDSQRWDMGEYLVLPGIVDLHGDGFERQLMPRPGVYFPLATALMETDRHMIANGITTAFHGLTYSWEPGLRGAKIARCFVDELCRLRTRLVTDTRLHLRFETFNLDAVDDVMEWLASGKIDLLAFNDHLDAIAQKIGAPEELSEFTGRSGLSGIAFKDLLQRTAARRHEVNDAVVKIASTARKYAIPMASHDDGNPESRAWYHELGSRLCEFPLDYETASHATQMGDAVIMGAPNVMRGGSHCERMAARDAIAEACCNVLASDYYYPSLLLAVFKLAKENILPLQRAWQLVSANPAQAVGLTDRGMLAAGKRADLIVVDDSDASAPCVVAVFVAGRLVYGRDLQHWIQ